LLVRFIKSNQTRYAEQLFLSIHLHVLESLSSEQPGEAARRARMQGSLLVSPIRMTLPVQQSFLLFGPVGM
jgi:hypothetical protein